MEDKNHGGKSHVYYSICIYIVTRQHAGTLTEDTALS